MSSVDWGDAPTWIAAVFAGGAALFAGMTIRSQRQQIDEQRVFIGEQSANLQLERTELRAVQEERRWAQAKQVVMHFETFGEEQDDEGNAVGYDRWVVRVTNGSDEPVRQILVRFGDTFNARTAVETNAQHLPDGGRRAVPMDLLGPGRTAIFESGRWSEQAVDNNRPVAHFTDAAGAAWCLNEHGLLVSEVDEPSGQ
ncbi:hypothetical protein [[Kitasatospora] papulosa]|uniref:hypothetical protein n=1 Tax=[Kitasatospora] papulosa TaxID=1464011 RepID=UPI003635D971